MRFFPVRVVRRGAVAAEVVLSDYTEWKWSFAISGQCTDILCVSGRSYITAAGNASLPAVVDTSVPRCGE